MFTRLDLICDGQTNGRIDGRLAKNKMYPNPDWGRHIFMYFLMNSRNRDFNPVFYQYFSNMKSLFAENSRAEPTTFSMKKILFFFKLLCGHFMGNPALRLLEVL